VWSRAPPPPHLNVFVKLAGLPPHKIPKYATGAMVEIYRLLHKNSDCYHQKQNDYVKGIRDITNINFSNRQKYAGKS